MFPTALPWGRRVAAGAGVLLAGFLPSFGQLFLYLGTVACVVAIVVGLWPDVRRIPWLATFLRRIVSPAALLLLTAAIAPVLPPRWADPWYTGGRFLLAAAFVVAASSLLLHFVGSYMMSVHPLEEAAVLGSSSEPSPELAALRAQVRDLTTRALMAERNLELANQEVRKAKTEANASRADGFFQGWIPIEVGKRATGHQIPRQVFKDLYYPAGHDATRCIFHVTVDAAYSGRSQGWRVQYLIQPENEFLEKLDYVLNSKVQTIPTAVAVMWHSHYGEYFSKLTAALDTDQHAVRRMARSKGFAEWQRVHAALETALRSFKNHDALSDLRDREPIFSWFESKWTKPLVLDTAGRPSPTPEGERPET